MKLLRANKERVLSSMSFEDLNVDIKCLSRQTRAAPLIPVSGITPSMYTSHVAATKQVEHSSADLLFSPSAKASKTKPNS